MFPVPPFLAKATQYLLSLLIRKAADELIECPSCGHKHEAKKKDAEGRPE